MNTKANMTVKEMQDFLNISRATAYELVNMSGFPAFRIGRKILVNSDSLREWMKAQEGKQNDENI
jgi:excisionase family DNA binding protein